MRYATSLLLSVGMSVLLSGAAGAADKIRIGLVLPDLSNQAIADIDTGARARAAELGNVEILTTASYSGEEQAKAIENYVAQKVDVIAYDSIDAAAVGPAIVKANEAKIPVIATISAAAGGKSVTFITPDFREDGRIIGRWMVGKLGKDGIVAHVEGNPADAAGAALTAGFKEGLATGGITKLVASAPSDWDREKALAVATDILTAHPDLQGLYGANDDVAMGALQAIKAAGRSGKILLAGHNGTCEALASILKGDLNFTVMLFNQPLGRLTVDTALKVLKGETVPDFMPAPVFGIDGPTAKAIAGGDLSAVPADLQPEVKARVTKAGAGCK
jgi:ABC-type sugar transport system substrate-binding protein